MKKNKKPIAALITDTHMNDHNFKFVENIFEQVINICKEKNIDFLFHGGDWFTSRKGQSIDCLLASERIFNMFSENNVGITCIAGNHDKDDQNRNESFLDACKGHFYLIKDYDFLIIGKIKFHFIPFFKNDKYIEILKNVTIGDSINILITHIAVDGVRNNDGSKVESPITKKLFDKFDNVFIGHYHNASILQANIHYVGSTYQANFGEDENKGLTIIYNDGSFEQIQLKFPLFKKFKIDASEINSSLVNDFATLKQDNPENNYRVIVTGKEENVKSVDRKLFEDAGISVDTKIENELIENISEEEIVEINGDSIKEFFNEFCFSKKIENKKYGIEKIKDAITN